MASINFYVGVSYLFFHLKRPKDGVNLPFAFLCASVGCYDLFCVGLYNAHTLQDGIFWQRLQFEAVAAISISLIWFTGEITNQKNKRIIHCLMAWFALLLLGSLVGSPDATLSPAHPAVKHVSLFHLLSITYYEGVAGIIYQIEMASGVLIYAYLCFLYLMYFRRTRHKTLILVIVSQITYFAGVINDTMVASGIYQFVYFSEYAFFFIIVSMAFVLLDQFMDLHTEFEALNANLEQKVEEKTREIREALEQVKRLEGIIPICAYCKKIRDNTESWHQLEQYITDHSDASFSHGICPTCLEQVKTDMKNRKTGQDRDRTV
jgi:hypothetical protein